MPWIQETIHGEIASLNPEAMKAIKHLNNVTKKGSSPLTLVQEELIGVVVSAANKCRH